MSKKLLRKKLALMLANLKKKRKYYCECEYLESTGTQYIDTGIKIDDTCGYDISWMALNADDRIIIGTKGSDDSRWVLSGDNNPYVNMSWNSVVTSDGLGLNKIQTAKMNYLNDRKRILNDTPLADITTTLSANASTYNVGIFAGYWGSSTVRLYSTCRIYYAKITKGTETIRYFIPVLDWDMTPCMYDKVSGQLFYNQGTGDFVAGRQIHPVEYLERPVDAGTGSSMWINTGLKYFADFEVGVSLRESITNTCLGTSSTERLERNSAAYPQWKFTSAEEGAYASNISIVGYHELKWKDGKIYADGVQLTTKAKTSTASTYPMVLFGIPTSATTANAYHNIIYFCKLWNPTDGTLVRDYIPAIDENGVGYMFDRVSHTIYDNAGTGTFAYPPVELEYLESTGTQYIDTGYIPNTNTYAELNAMYTSLDSTYRTPFSVRAYDGAANSFTIAGATNAANVYAFGSQYWSGDNGCPIAYTNVKYFMSLKAGVAIFNGVTGNAGTTITPTTLTAYMFARNANGTAANFFKGRIYNCLIKESSSIIKDFIPCFKDGSSGMLDKANNMFYTNAGTGTFVAGKIIEPEYE